MCRWFTGAEHTHEADGSTQVDIFLYSGIEVVTQAQQDRAEIGRRHSLPTILLHNRRRVLCVLCRRPHNLKNEQGACKSMNASKSVSGKAGGKGRGAKVGNPEHQAQETQERGDKKKETRKSTN